MSEGTTPATAATAAVAATSAAVGANEAITAFVALERPRLLRTAVLLVGSRSEAEEAVQDALGATAARWATLDRPAAYAHTSVVNACRMILRRRDLARDRAHLVRPAPPDTPRDLVELLDVLRSLSDRQRIAIVLRYVVDLTDDDIATALECRPATVRSLIRRGLAQLRKELS